MHLNENAFSGVLGCRSEAEFWSCTQLPELLGPVLFPVLHLQLRKKSVLEGIQKGRGCYYARTVLSSTQAVLCKVPPCRILCVQIPPLGREVLWSQGLSHSCI